MALPAGARFAQRLVALGLLVACAGPGLHRAVTIADGQRTTVRLLSGNLVLSLQNESAVPTVASPTLVTDPSTREVHTVATADPGRKVVADADLQALLDVFSEQKMFERSLAVVPPDARDVLVVEQGNRRWTWARRQLGVQASEQSFHEARAYFLSLYNSSVAYHGTGKERPNFGSENVKAKSSGEEARARLEQLRSQGR